MSAYIVAGYVIALSTLFLYSVTLVVRVRAARRRLGRIEGEGEAAGGRGGGASPATDRP